MRPIWQVCRCQLGSEETEKKKELVEYNQLASLAVGECYTLLPEPKVRLSKMQIPQDKGRDITEGFIQK